MNYANLDIVEPESEKRPHGASGGSWSEKLVQPEKNRSGLVDFVALRKAVSMRQVLELINFVPTTERGAALRGPCPLHSDDSDHGGGRRSRTFSVNLDKNAFRCMKSGCDGDKGGNQLDLWMLVSKEPSVYRAAINLCERLGIDVPRAGKNPSS